MTICKRLAALVLMLTWMSTGRAVGWEWSLPHPTGFTLNDVAVGPDGAFWSVGDNGTVLTRPADGNQWTVVPTPTPANLNGVTVSDRGEVIAVGDSGTCLIRGTSGTWTSARTGVYVRLNDIAMADDVHGWIVGYDAILATDDGGISWRPVFTQPGTEVLSVAAFDARNAIAVAWSAGHPHGQAATVSMSDGGAWTLRGFGPAYRFTDVWADRGGERAWVCGEALSDNTQPLVIHTSDRGTHWRQHPFNASGKLASIVVTGNTVTAAGVAESRKAWVVQSADDGESWQGSYLPVEIPLNSISGTTKDSLVAVGEAGLVFGPADPIANGGDTPQRDELMAVGFRTAERGIAVGINGMILSTEDGGATWHAPRRPMPSDYSDVVWTSRDVAYAIGEGGLMLRTLDAGRKWEIISPLEGVDITALAARGNELWAVGHDAAIHRSSDRGNSWTAIESPANTVFIDVAIAPDGAVTILSGDGNLWRTDNGGVSWEQHRVKRNARTRVVATPADDRVVVLYQDSPTDTVSVLAFSENGGGKWSSSSVPGTVTAMAFADALHGAAVSSAALFITADGGATWAEKTVNADVSFNGVTYVGDTVWIVGSRGAILKYVP